jgi:hypothetical protein
MEISSVFPKAKPNNLIGHDNEIIKIFLFDILNIIEIVN